MKVFDIEADGLLDDLSVIHCINVIDTETGQRLRFNDHPEVSDTNRAGTVEDGIACLKAEVDSGGIIAGHNILKYDVPAIQALYGDFEVHPDRMLDTLIVSRLIWTNIADIDARALRRGKRPPEFRKLRLSGRHSLEAWGWRLGDYKGDFKGPWDTFTKEMDDYCAQDVEVTLKLVEKIAAEEYSDDAIRLEHRVADIIRMQEDRGFRFDRPAAEKLEGELFSRKAELEDGLRSAFQPWYQPETYKGRNVVVNPKRKRRAKVVSEDGHTWLATYTPEAEYCKVKLVSFEPNSRDKIADRLETLYGWQPSDFTKTGKPKVDETTLSGLPYPEAEALVDYLMVDKRLGLLSTGKAAWLTQVADDGRIYGNVNPNGAVTGRMTHSGPNLAQVPKVKKDKDGNIKKGADGGYGFECRSMFLASNGYMLVGVDADGLELRMLGHYTASFDGGSYAKEVVAGDAHTLNMKAIGLNLRENAKTWIYAYIYGAGDRKLGVITYDDMTDEQKERFDGRFPTATERERGLASLGRRGRNRIEKSIPALGELQKRVKAKARQVKRLKGLDGRLLHVRAQHSSLNTLLQGGGAIVMKKALVLTYDELVSRGLTHGKEFAFVANVHDEFQMEVLPEFAEEVGGIAADAIAKAGEAYDLRVPLAGSADYGETWADTH